MTYKPLVGEDLYTVAAKLYGNDTYLGVSDLLKYNTVDLTTSDLSGTTLTYTAGITRKKPQFLLASPPQSYGYITGQFQTIYDLAIQLFGDVQKISLLINAFPDLNNEITAGQTITLSPSTNPIAVYFYNRNLRIATSVTVTTTTGRRLLEDSTFRLLEDSTFRLLEH